MLSFSFAKWSFVILVGRDTHWSNRSASTWKTTFWSLSKKRRKTCLIQSKVSTEHGSFLQLTLSVDRIRQGKGRIRKSKVDYLFYSLVDVIVDHYMDVLDTMGTKVESIDNQLMKTLKRDTLESIYEMKRDMLYLRATISPLKEIIIKLQKEEETQIMQESTNIYLKDLFDHVVQVNDSIDTYREMLASFIDFYMMLNSNAMNEVVKTLTIISTIFIPLTFISGVYGMVSWLARTCRRYSSSLL